MTKQEIMPGFEQGIDHKIITTEGIDPKTGETCIFSGFNKIVPEGEEHEFYGISPNGAQKKKKTNIY